MTNSLGKILERAENWPEDARYELEQLARDIEAELRGGAYQPTPSEIAGIERGLRESANGRFASAEQVEKALSKLRQ